MIWCARILRIGLCGLLTACASHEPLSNSPLHMAERAQYEVEIRWTSFHIPHIKAKNFKSLGYGIGYAYAESNICLLADTILTVRGERSRFFGANESTTVGVRQVKNLESDLFFKFYLKPADLSASYAKGAQEIVDLIAGYAAGYNRYLRDTGLDALPPLCRNAPWVRSITPEDIYLLLSEKAIQASGSGFLEAITGAQPPGAPKAAADLTDVADASTSFFTTNSPLGSNAYALGRELTANGAGLLVGNPHFPWQGPNRFFELHLIVPGALDVMGASLPPFPVVNIGFNHDIAWSHTVSTGHRFTLYTLHLIPGNPLAYSFDDQIEFMHPEVITIEVLSPGGTVSPYSRILYNSRFGPLLTLPTLGLDWTTSKAFAIRDAQRLNTRMSEQWLRINQAHSVAEILRSLETVHGAPWVNTIAADRVGEVLYADISVVPYVSQSKQERCTSAAVTPDMGEQNNLTVLDGSRSECVWDIDAAAPEVGLMPARLMPRLVRQDYVLNSNDSFWLANAQTPLTGYPKIIGLVDSLQGWRTRMSYKQLGELMTSKRGQLTVQDLEAMLLSNRNYTAELISEQLNQLCSPPLLVKLPQRKTIDIRPACQVLEDWDRRDDVESRGAALYREFWREAQQIDQLWRVSFDPSQALSTPHGLNLRDPRIHDKLRTALANAVTLFQDLGLALDTPLGLLQRRATQNGFIPIPGGDEFEGVLNKVTFGALTREGYVNQEIYGSSYIQVVTWHDAVPIIDALLTYSQSSNSDSAYYADQTKLYANKAWVRLPFTEAEIVSNPDLRTLHLVQ